MPFLSSTAFVSVFYQRDRERKKLILTHPTHTMTDRIFGLFIRRNELPSGFVLQVSSFDLINMD